MNKSDQINELQAIETIMDPSREMEIYNPQGLNLTNPPEEVLGEAKKAAMALKDVISKKSKPVMFNGEQYLEFEDWQTVGRFYGITAKVISTSPVDFGDIKGFEARAVAIHASTGNEISAADSMCLNDEKNWSSKPLFQLRSMAQTRACAKALRNVLAWVVVLAGYRPTPAEELPQDQKQSYLSPIAQPVRKSEVAPSQNQSNPSPVISEAQSKRLYAIYKNNGITDEQMKDYLMREYGYEHSKDIKKSDYEAICNWASMTNEPGSQG